MNNYNKITALYSRLSVGDDDESGRFFDRSAYSRMMEDVESRIEVHERDKKRAKQAIQHIGI